MRPASLFRLNARAGKHHFPVLDSSCREKIVFPKILEAMFGSAMCENMLEHPSRRTEAFRGNC